MAEWESGIGLLEPYLESILQVNIQLCSFTNHVFIDLIIFRQQYVIIFSGSFYFQHFDNSEGVQFQEQL